MNAFNGTPGPWHVEHYSRGSCEVKISRPVGTKGMGPVAYALMDLAGAMTDERIAEMKANARLIAAAPELLNLAERVARLNRDAGRIGAGMLAHLIDEARAAIAKVTGEQP